MGERKLNRRNGVNVVVLFIYSIQEQNEMSKMKMGDDDGGKWNVNNSNEQFYICIVCLLRFPSILCCAKEKKKKKIKEEIPEANDLGYFMRTICNANSVTVTHIR